MCLLLGYNISTFSMDEIVEKVISTEKKIHIISGNPEVLYNGIKDDKLYYNFVSDKAVIIPDGIGVVKVARLKGYKIKKIAGIDVFIELIKSFNKNQTVYLLGSHERVVKLIVDKLNSNYKNLNIIGYHNGYIDVNNCKNIIDDIKSRKPYAIFVAMGSPRQEEFILKYMDELPCKIFMGVGGTFDVVSGFKKRAPKIFLNANLEWLYRIIKEPKRFIKIYKNILFIIYVIINRTEIKSYTEEYNK